MADHATQVIGCLAVVAKGKVMAAGEACLVLGSVEAMRHHLREVAPDLAGNARIRKTRFGDIMRALYAGGTYAFDRESYGRFFPLAKEEQLAVRPVDFEDITRRGFGFVTVALDEAELITKPSR